MTADQSAAPVGIIAAMPLEARAMGVSGPHNELIETDGNTLLYVCGVGANNARRATNELVAAKAGSVVSWGTAGGLATDIATGTALLPGSVVCEDAAYETDRNWVSRLAGLIASKVSVDRRAIYSGGLLVSGAADKRRLAEETGAVAVDMESGAIAETAAAAGVPFICVRVIVDPSSFSLPATLGGALDDEGFVSLKLAMRGLIRRPGDIVPMLQLATHFRHATGVLAQIYRTAGPRLRAP